MPRIFMPLMAVLLSGCAAIPFSDPHLVEFVEPPGWGRPPCLTACGLVSTDVDCRELQELEFETLKALHTFAGFKFERSCEALDGWTVNVHAFYTVEDLAACNSGAWVYSPGVCILGFTHEVTRRLEIDRGPLQTGSLVHEITHVVDRAHRGELNHCKWRARGLRSAIEAVTGEVELETFSQETTCGPGQ